MMWAVGMAGALLVGVLLGLLGGGGSILTVPLLVYVLGVEPRTAIAMSLVVVGVTSASGALLHARAGRVRWRTALLFGAGGMAGAFLGGKLNPLLSPTMLLLCFAGVMVAASVAMLLRSDAPTPVTSGHVTADLSEARATSGRVEPSTSFAADQHAQPTEKRRPTSVESESSVSMGHTKKPRPASIESAPSVSMEHAEKPRPASIANGFPASVGRTEKPHPASIASGASVSVMRVVAQGVGVGILSGLVGAGGGFLIVPALTLVGLSTPMATATSLVVIALQCAAGLIGHLGHAELPWRLTGEVLAIALVGSMLGGRFAGRVAPGVLRRGFALFVLATATFLLLAQLPRTVLGDLTQRLASAGAWPWLVLATGVGLSTLMVRKHLRTARQRTTARGL
ncbi:sulfite exporter TauE/SafE family protein [Myxococcus faecalis]|uniref:sulfite exporter TauE/SafE family protein n=1 Tax=Myxococcus TaxID=32 RepID=UPI001CBD2D35|nr:MULTISPECIES: sulfite exporter TauE/SafE family protein [unclassified Myxococcus]MBZ4395180.1 sulfite exporter TauE/SafE family protein [Myxococcus sp. AS-1-15]MBZ4414646.1 sulfite exporter TauE/SafE family protein [Myxococcus sp. XM-1-1-1]